MSLIPFVGAMLILAATPGPGVFAVLGKALSGGVRPALWTIAGIILGDLIFLALAAGGLSVLAHTLGDLFLFVRIAGALYLIWLGLKAWRYQPHPRGIVGQGSHSRSKDFLTGLLITLGNPKVILFYAGFLPTFLPIEQLTVGQWGQVGGVVALTLWLVLGGYALLADRVRHWFSNPSTYRYLHRTAGTLMVGTGAVLLIKR